MTPVDQALAFAYGALGTLYLWDGKGPLRFDCSGLTACAWAAAGYEIGAGTEGQLSQPGAVFILNPGANAPWSQTCWEFLRGDILFPSSEHCQIYDGAGMIVESPSTGLRVRRVPQWATTLYAVRRIVPGIPGASLLWPGTLLTVGVNYYGTGKWQQKMNQLGIVKPPLLTDSSYGNLTADATRAFQRKMKLGVTGQVDGHTWTAAFR